MIISLCAFQSTAYKWTTHLTNFYKDFSISMLSKIARDRSEFAKVFKSMTNAILICFVWEVWFSCFKPRASVTTSWIRTQPFLSDIICYMSLDGHRCLREVYLQAFIILKFEDVYGFIVSTVKTWSVITKLYVAWRRTGNLCKDNLLGSRFIGL